MSAPTPGSDEWRKVVTASKAAAIIGVSPWESPYSIWHEMKHGVAREQNDAMRRGNYLEPAILAWWRDQHPELLAMSPMSEQRWFPHEDWAGATVDGCLWAADPAELGLLPSGIGRPSDIVEAKSAVRMDEWGRPGTDEIPAYYLAQVYFQLAVTGAERCYVPVIGPYLEFSEYVVEADAEFQADILAQCRTFYDTLAADEPPNLDGSVATYNVARKIHADIEAKTTVELTPQDAHEFVASALALDEAEQRARLARSTLLEVMGRAQFADSHGIRVARRQNSAHGVNLVRVAKTTTSLTEGTAA